MDYLNYLIYLVDNPEPIVYYLNIRDTLGYKTTPDTD